MPPTRTTWRIALAGQPGVVLHRAIMTDPTECSPSAADLAELRAEPPDAHGIRRRFVDRVKQLIAAGHYDSPERWAVAEELLVRSLEDER